MPKGFREAAEDRKSKALPEPHRPFIGGHDEIELHGAEAPGPGTIQGMRAHGAGDTSTGRGGCGNVAAVGYVGAAAGLIGAKEVSPNGMTAVLRDEHFVAGREPERESLPAAHLAGQGVGLSRSDYRFENGPDRIRIARERCPDGHRSLSNIPICCSP